MRYKFFWGTKRQNGVHMAALDEFVLQNYQNVDHMIMINIYARSWTSYTYSFRSIASDLAVGFIVRHLFG